MKTSENSDNIDVWGFTGYFQLRKDNRSVNLTAIICNIRIYFITQCLQEKLINRHVIGCERCDVFVFVKIDFNCRQKTNAK